MTRTSPAAWLGSITLLLAISAGVNVLQAQRIRSLLDPRAPEASMVGKQAPPLAGFSLTGAAIEMPLRGDVPTLVYFFSPTCGWCERNWANIEALRGAAGGRYRLVAVSSARRIADYVRAHGIGVQVVEGISDKSRRILGFNGTPRTIVISPDGLITHDWRGAYTPRIARQIEQLFDVVLPGLASNVPVARPALVQ